MVNDEISDNELEAIRQRKLAELQRAREAQIQKEQQEAQAKAQIEAALKQILTVDAWDQWNNAKFANEQNAYSAAIALLKAAQSRQIKGKINKEQLKGVLLKISQMTTREFKIKRV